MNIVSVTILRDPESPEWWLANFTFDGRSYTTQGAIVDEARYMAADLLQVIGAGPETEMEFVLEDRQLLSSVLANPVTPSLITAPDTGELAGKS